MQRTRCFRLLAASILLTVGLPVDATESAAAAEPQVLFDGRSTDAWEFRDGAWSIDADGALTCHLEEIKQKNGTVRTRGMGYIWTKESYGDFELTLT